MEINRTDKVDIKKYKPFMLCTVCIYMLCAFFLYFIPFDPVVSNVSLAILTTGVVATETFLGGYPVGIAVYILVDLTIFLFALKSHLSFQLNVDIIMVITILSLTIILATGRAREMVTRRLYVIGEYGEQMLHAEEKLGISLLRCDVDGVVEVNSNPMLERHGIQLGVHLFHLLEFSVLDYAALKHLQAGWNQPVCIEKECLLISGWQYFHLTLIKASDVDGGSIGYWIYLRDLTQYEILSRNRNEILSEMGDVFVRLKEDFTIQSISPSVKRFGYVLNDLMGHDFRDVIFFDDRIQFEDAFQIVMNENNGNAKNYRLYRRDDGIVWVDMKMRIIREQNGDRQVRVIIRDIDKLKRTEQAYRVIHQKYHMFMDHTSVAFVIYRYENNSAPGVVIEVNQRFEELTGYSSGEIINKRFLDIFTERSNARYMTQYKKAYTEQRINFEIELEMKNQRNFVADLLLTVFECDGEKFVLVGIQDLTEKKDRAELQASWEQIQEYDRLQREFFANLSHEIRTPVGLIFNAQQIMSGELETEHLEKRNAIDRHMNIIQKNGYRLMKLVNNLLDLTKIQSGYIEMRWKNANIVEIVEEAVLSVKELVEARGMELIFDTNEEEVIMRCDEEKMERVMLNLLSNATKFCKAGDQISVVMDCDEKVVKIYIRDTGEGIPPEKMDVIFERFRQVDHLMTRKKEGSGLGLSIVKALVEMHQGSVSINPLYTEGAEFVISLPRLPLIDSGEKTFEKLNDDRSERTKIEFSDIDK